MKAKILGLLTGITALALAMPVFAVPNYITIPDNFVASLKATVGEVFTDLTVPLVLVITLPIAFWFLGKVVSLVRGGLTGRGRRA